MKVEMAVLAEAATVNDDGRMNVLGIFDEVEVEEFPAVIGDRVLAMRISLGFADGRKSHLLRIEGRDEDGAEQWSIEADIDAGDIPPGEGVTLSPIFHLKRMTAESAGDFTITAFWDGERRWEGVARITGPANEPRQRLEGSHIV